MEVESAIGESGWWREEQYYKANSRCSDLRDSFANVAESLIEEANTRGGVLRWWKDE